MESWDEIRTAYQVAKHGTVSGAAGVLGVHHATVIRHIDALEAQLGVKLFQRHARGYTATEAGQDLLLVAGATDDQFSQLAGRLRGRGDAVTGDLIVTSIPELAPLLVPVLASFQDQHPGLVARMVTGEQVLRLEYGEAHVAIRAGSAPQEPDNVVQPLGKMPGAFFATKDYVDARGIPADETEIEGHHFVGHDNPLSKAPFDSWLRSVIPHDQIIFRATDRAVGRMAVKQGAGIGFLPVLEGYSDPNLVEIWGPRPEWSGDLWLVTHVDLHRTLKVRSFSDALKDAAKSWPTL